MNEPSTVAVNKNTGEMEAVGKLAKEMLGRTPLNLVVTRPLKEGVIADFKVTEKMLNYFIQKAHQRRTLVHPRVVISVPSEITQVEKRAVTSAYRAKAAEVHLVLVMPLLALAQDTTKAAQAKQEDCKGREGINEGGNGHRESQRRCRDVRRQGRN